MADFIASRTNILALFKEVYGERVAEQPNREAFMMNQFNASTRMFGGKYWTVPILAEGDGTNNSGPGAVGSYAEDEEVADAGAEATQELRIQPKNHYATVRITGLARAASRSNLFAFVEAKDFELKQKTRWLISQLNAQFYQNGRGVMGRAGIDPTTNDITIASTPAGNPDNPIPPMTWFRVGGRIDIFADGTPIGAKRTTAGKKGGRTITAITGRTITYSDADIAAIVANETGTGDIVTYEDAQESIPAGEIGKQLAGLSQLVDDGTDGPATVQNIDGTVFGIWNANVLANSATNRELSLDLLQQLLDTNRIKSGQESTFLISGYGLRRKYLNLLWYDVRYGPQDLKGGFTVLKFDHLDWYVDKDCPLGRVWAFTKEMIKKYVVKPLGILDEAGSQAERIPKTDTYEILLGGYFNIGIEQRNATGRLQDLTDPAVGEGL